jgi:hypothetical protein
MKSINQKTELEEKIAYLKLKKSDDFYALQEQYNETVESLKPLNLIKSATRKFITDPNLKTNLLNGAIGLGTNYLSKTLMNENTLNPVKRVLGKVLKFAMKNFIGKKSMKI